MPKWPALSSKEIEKMLRKNGFVFTYQILFAINCQVHYFW